MNFRLRSASLLLAIAVLSQPAAAGLFGPSTELLKGDALAAKLKAQQVVLSAGGGVLDIRTKGAAVGSFLVGFIVSSALASGGGATGNAQQMQKNMQANMQIATSFNQNLQVAMTQVASDQAAKPKAQIAKEGPVIAVSQQLMASLLQEPGIKMSLASAAQPAAPADLQLRVSQPEWKLDFSMASSEYTLRYQIDASLYQKESDTVFYKQSCKGEVPRKLALEDWERDDFSEVALAAADVANSCAATLIAALGLRPVPVAPLSPPARKADPTVESAVPALPVPAAGTSQAEEPASPAVEAQK
ncbi:hypothetical protein ACEN8I_05750 [Polaromonas sp. CT11-55]|uniref:hypothetical protein n=1 Tax=Polaromonas sp. CT11-55 TaxID=3243045 RepID=UPI0039A44A04